MLVDANLLLFAVDSTSPFHVKSRDWLQATLRGSRRVGMPWPVLIAFLRISTHARASAHPLAPAEAAAFVTEWLAADAVWTPEPTNRHAEVLHELIQRHDLRGPMTSDAHLAALAIEHGLTVCSADTDFARFPEVSWHNPLA